MQTTRFSREIGGAARRPSEVRVLTHTNPWERMERWSGVADESLAFRSVWQFSNFLSIDVLSTSAVKDAAPSAAALIVFWPRQTPLAAAGLLIMTW